MGQPIITRSTDVSEAVALRCSYASDRCSGPYRRCSTGVRPARASARVRASAVMPGTWNISTPPEDAAAAPKCLSRTRSGVPEMPSTTGMASSGTCSPIQ